MWCRGCSSGPLLVAMLHNLTSWLYSKKTLPTYGGRQGLEFDPWIEERIFFYFHFTPTYCSLSDVRVMGKASARCADR
jgi:hypothetical protein